MTTKHYYLSLEMNTFKTLCVGQDLTVMCTPQYSVWWRETNTPIWLDNNKQGVLKLPLFSEISPGSKLTPGSN